MKLFALPTICALLAAITHAVPGPLVPAPAVPAPIIEARQLSFPIALVILFGVDGVQVSVQVTAIDILVPICTYLPYSLDLPNYSELFILALCYIISTHILSVLTSLK